MKNFVLVASVCCFITAITTIIIHMIPYHEMTFDERALLYKDATYFRNKIIIITHCFFFMIAMWGVFLTIYKKAVAYSGLGLLFFCLFSITEIIRQLLVLFYLNGLREKYIETTSVAAKEILKVNIESFGFINYMLFTIFIISFGLGAIFYGLGLLQLKKTKFIQWLAILMLIWGIGSFLAFGNTFWNISWLGEILAPYNLYYQSFIRILLAVWLWKFYKQLQVQ